MKLLQAKKSKMPKESKPNKPSQETALKATDLATKVANVFPYLYAFFDGLLKTN